MSLVRPTTPLALAAPGLPALRLLPAPATEPPYDDEPGQGAGLRLVHPAPVSAARTATAVQPAALLAPSVLAPPDLAPPVLVTPVLVPAAPPARAATQPPAVRPLAAQPPAGQAVAGRAPAAQAPAAQPPAAQPPARPFAVALVQRLLEVRAGVRPLPQLQRDTTPGLYADLERVLTARPRSTGRRPTRKDVLSVHVQERPDGVAEVCATVARGERAAALALRLQAAQGRWFCTELAGL